MQECQVMFTNDSHVSSRQSWWYVRPVALPVATLTGLLASRGLTSCRVSNWTELLEQTWPRMCRNCSIVVSWLTFGWRPKSVYSNW